MSPASGTALRPLDRARRLGRGDRVAVVAPSGPVQPDRLDRGVGVLRSWGLEVVVGQHVLARHRHLAGSDDQRAQDLQQAWCDPTVRAVVVRPRWLGGRADRRPARLGADARGRARRSWSASAT